MGRIFETIEKFFIEDEWNYIQLGDSPILKLEFAGDNGEWQCFAQVNEELFQFVFYSVCAVRVPRSKRADMMEFLSRVNFGLIIGNFRDRPRRRRNPLQDEHRCRRRSPILCADQATHLSQRLDDG